MVTSDEKYIQSKIDHMKRAGINAGRSETGAARPDHVKAEAEERKKRQDRITARRKWGKEYHEEYDNET